MGNRHTSNLPPYESVSKRLTPKEVDRAREAIEEEG